MPTTALPLLLTSRCSLSSYWTQDDDGKYGDFGKVDFEKRNSSDTSASDSTDAGSWVAGQDGTAENAGNSTDNKCTDDDGGDGCDAEFTRDGRGQPRLGERLRLQGHSHARGHLQVGLGRRVGPLSRG